MKSRYVTVSWILLGLLLVLLLIHVNGGLMHYFTSVSEPIADPGQSMILFREFRIPRTFMAIIAGMGLSISGLLMQTMFNNPLAGPSVLGITSGSILFVAVAMLSGLPVFLSDLGIVAIALLGAMVFSGIILLFSFFVKSQISLLLIGMMLGSFTGAMIDIMGESAQANQLKIFTLWGFGSVQHVNFDQIPLILTVFLIGIFALTFLIKPLNLLVIGEKPTQLLGVQLKSFRILIIAVTAVFAGLITAYCGPIGFIGLAVPNIVKSLYKTQNHLLLILGSALAGACTLLFCDLLVLWIEPWYRLPLSGVTALFGAPVVVWIILKKF